MNWHLPDTRLSARADHLFETIVSTGSLVLRRIGGDRAGEVAAHRFLDNERVSHEAIIDTLSFRTQEACRGRKIIAIQDTTEVNFAGRDASRKGLGQAGGDKSVGFFIHPVIAVDMSSGSVLGLINAKIWTRDNLPKVHRKHIPFEDKESCRWLHGAETAQTRLQEADHVTVVGDRENDIYSVFARRPEKVDLLVRASHNRKLSKKKRLFNISHDLEEFAPITVGISAKPGQKARKAEVILRAGTVILPRSYDNKEADEPDEVEVNFIEAIEENSPKGSKAVNWRLLTTLPIATQCNVEDAINIYRMRWRIEEVFRALKSDGLDLEATQVEEAGRLFKLAALGLAAATRIIQLVDARDESTRPATDMIDEELIDPIDAIGKTLEGKTERQKNPHEKGSLPWLSWIVARLGGWNCYYKPPGPKTMATGWKQLSTMAGGYILAKGTGNV